MRTNLNLFFRNEEPQTQALSLRNPQSYLSNAPINGRTNPIALRNPFANALSFRNAHSKCYNLSIFQTQHVGLTHSFFNIKKVMSASCGFFTKMVHFFFHIYVNGQKQTKLQKWTIPGQSCQWCRQHQLN